MHKGCKRRGRMGHLARAKTGVGARQLKSWRAKLARQLGSWRANSCGMQRSRAWCGTPPILGVVNMVGTRNFTCYMGAL